MTRKMILELEGESLTWRDVLPSLLEHLPDVRRKRHEAQQMLAEEPLALISARPGEHAPGGGELDASLLELGEREEVQGRRERQQFTRRQSKPARESGEAPLPAERRRGEAIQKSHQSVDGGVRKRLQPAALQVPLRAERFAEARGERRVEIIDDRAECRVEPVARMRQRHNDLGRDAAGLRGG